MSSSTAIAETGQAQANLRFGRFEWLPQQRQVRADGRPVPVGARAFDLLSVLLQNRSRVVSKAELLERAWPGMVVEDNNLSVQVSALRKLLGEGSVATVAGRGYQWALPVEPFAGVVSAGRGPARPSLAVLPFDNAGGNPAEEYFADGLAEDIVASLAKSRWLLVIAHSSSMAFRASRSNAGQICMELGVSYLVRGAVRRMASMLWVNVELLDGKSGETLWAQRFERTIDSLFDVQEEIAAKIVGTVEPVFLKREELQASRRGVRDLQHWDLLMQARWHYWRSSRKHSVEAKKLLQQALALHPEDVPALSLLAFSLSTDVWSGWAEDPKATATQAHKLALRAVALDDGDSFAHFTLGVTMLGFEQVERAIAEHRRALELHPHFAAAAAELGRLLAFSGRSAEGEALIRQAMEASPTEPRMSLWIFSLAIASFVDEKYAQAVQHAAMAVAHRPDWFFNHYLLAACLSANGELEAAREALAEGVRLVPDFTVATLRIGHPFTQDAHRQRYIAALRNAGWQG